MTEPNLFDNTEMTVLGELERVFKNRIEETKGNPIYGSEYRNALRWAVSEINRLKPTEIEKLKLAFQEGGSIPQSAESWVRKFKTDYR